MKKLHKRVWAGAGALALVGAGLYLAGFRVLFDSGRVHFVRKVVYHPRTPSGGEAPRRAGPLKSIELLTPDDSIRSNMGEEAFMAQSDVVVKAAEAALAGAPGGAKLSL
ncbi:hypothetical protein EPO15_15385, partial [bacterium]